MGDGLLPNPVSLAHVVVPAAAVVQHTLMPVGMYPSKQS